MSEIDPPRVVVRAPGALAPRERAQASIRWESSELDGRARARRLRLPMIVYLRAEWSAGSLEMERRSWSDPRVIQRAAGFVAIRIDLSAADASEEMYAERYDVQGVPSTIVYDDEGRRVASLVGAADAEAILRALARAE